MREFEMRVTETCGVRISSRVRRIGLDHTYVTLVQLLKDGSYITPPGCPPCEYATVSALLKGHEAFVAFVQRTL